MIKLTPTQAHTLYEIIKFANQHFGRIPTGPEFSERIGIEPRGALARINRILNKTNFHYKGNNSSKYINYELIVTEKESAASCLKIYNISKENDDGRMTKDDIFNALHISELECEKFIKTCCIAEYLVPMPNVAGYRASPKLENHSEYFKVFISK